MTAVIAPSRRLRCLLGGFGAFLLAAGCAVGFPAPVVFATSAGVPAAAGFSAAVPVAAMLLFAGACVVHTALHPAMVHRIDISGLGQLRLTVQQGVRRDKITALPVRLLPGSTLWPRLMLLRLEAAGNGVAGAAAEGTHGWLLARRGPVFHRLLVLPDSLPPDAFRALAVALGASGARSGAASMQHKIL